MDILDIAADALIDALKMLPFLYAAFLFMEYIEHKAGSKLAEALEKAGRSNIGGSAAGAALGCIPQCGFSAAASNLYASRVIGAGTLMAVYISTSDEAVPILLAHPEMIGSLWKLLAAKIIIAVIGGAVFGLLMKLIFKDEEDVDFEEICTSCGCGDHSIWYSSLKHALNIFLFILAVNLVMGLILGAAGEENVSAFLDRMGAFQPFAASLVGMIPNCASSVIITELYAGGSISFGTAVGGLCTGAGVGLAVIFRENKNIRENLLILAYLYAVGVLSGTLLNLLM